ncbi:AraC family transcriptional regulator [Marinomonas spartinae]|uniref:AraC family transcriptional regulator n=1 Tax=Marinomonas spartinae TaxID=1792290 RepID=UPI0018F26D49|nr:AraC family transcriptional regulator [Marinomonas spartinae]MBJ7555982.1 AraC family transcriptional regulator [Marinomonas spartinae]
MSSDIALSRLLQNVLKSDSERLIFSSGTLEQVRDEVSEVYKPHHLDLKEKGSELDTRMHSVALGNVYFNRLKYGADVIIDPGCLEQFYLIQMPVAGQAKIYSGENAIYTNKDIASVLNPSDPLTMDWSKDCDQLMFKIDKQSLELVCSQVLGRSLREPLRFKPDMHWYQNPVWRNMMIYLAHLLHDLPSVTTQSTISHQLEQLIINTLLSIHPHNYTDALNEPVRTLAPRHVKKVEEYIEAHADEALSPAKLANIAGVSVRTLYAGFKDFRHISPMEYLRTVRLQRAREDLLKQNPNISITDIAIRWGFTHMGRFSQEYARLFGERPSDTKRR